jgi:uncharacterized repeat protein (TIGR03803 family)
MARSVQSRLTSTCRLLLAAFLTLALFIPAAPAQTLTVLHTFTGGADGSTPGTNLVMDSRGNIYGTTQSNPLGFGEVFELVKHGSSWVLYTLYVFAGGDGSNPSVLMMGSDGSLYGTNSGGGHGEYGTVYKLTPPATACKSASCRWSYTKLYDFTGQSDGGNPFGQLVERNGNLYGTTLYGGEYPNGCETGHGCGTVYELSPSQGGWTETVLYSFRTSPDAWWPYAGVIFDPAGNLYGTTYAGGTHNDGAVFELSPSGSGWTETILHSFGAFGGDGRFPFSSLLRDGGGNLYGVTNMGGAFNSGTVFSLAPSNGEWTENVLYSFDYIYGDGNPTFGGLIMDASGNLYGTSPGQGGLPSTQQYFGNVFMMTPSNGGWNYINLHTFACGADGGDPFSTPIMDSNGNLYGTASIGGEGCFENGYGTVWELTP